MLLSSVVGTRWARIVLPTSVLMLLVVLVYTLWTRGGESASKRREKLAGVIVFWRETPWPSLWSVQPDGSGLRRIYDTRQNAKRPRLSPDGEWIAFDGAAPGKEPLSDFDVQVVRVDGSDRRTLAGTPEYEVDAQWSPNGTTLCYSSYRHTGETDEWLASRISTVTVEGGDRKMLGLGSPLVAGREAARFQCSDRGERRRPLRHERRWKRAAPSHGDTRARAGCGLVA